MRIKISKNDIQLVTKAISQAAPKAMSCISEVATPVIKKANSYMKPVVDVVVKNPGKTILGALGVGVAVDDIYQHHSNKVLKESKTETKAALQKHEAEMQVLRIQAEKAENLEIINEQLCNVIKETNRKGEPDEEIHEDGATDK